MTDVYYRKGERPNFTYEDVAGEPVTEPSLLEYMAAIGAKIPPSYTNVRIYHAAAGTPKILFIGTDKAGRDQPRYSAEHVAGAERRKYCQVLNLARNARAIADRARDEMKDERPTRTKAIALIIRLMMLCHFRIGNERFYDKHGSIGARNVRKKHVTLARDEEGRPYAYMTFPGKKGVINTCHIYDVALLRELTERMRISSAEDELFTYVDNGRAIAVTAIEVNDWLKTFDPSITSKHFRTYDANIVFIRQLRASGDPTGRSLGARRATLKAAFEMVANVIQNTPTVARDNYIHPDIITMYLEEPPARFVRAFMDPAITEQRAFADFLAVYCAGKEQAPIQGGRRRPWGA
jgi:DNA topoisomerase-1